MGKLSLVRRFGPRLAYQMATRDVLTVPIDGTTYKTINDRSEQYHILNSTQKLRNLVGCIPEDAKTIVDLGANVGLFALLAARASPQASITCYEADPRLADLASENTPDNVSVVASAVTRDGGEVTFFRSHNSHQLGSLRKASVVDFDPDAEAVSVPSVSIREALSHSVDFLKVDIQGAEWDLFQDFDFSSIKKAVFEISFLDPGAIDLLERLRLFFPNYRVVNAVHGGGDVLFSR